MLSQQQQEVVVGTCLGIVEGPNLLSELQVSEEDTDPNPRGEPEFLGLGMEDGATHARNQQDRVTIRHWLLGTLISKTRTKTHRRCSFSDSEA